MLVWGPFLSWTWNLLITNGFRTCIYSGNLRSWNHKNIPKWWDSRKTAVVFSGRDLTSVWSSWGLLSAVAGLLANKICSGCFSEHQPVTSRTTCIFFCYDHREWNGWCWLPRMRMGLIFLFSGYKRSIIIAPHAWKPKATVCLTINCPHAIFKAASAILSLINSLKFQKFHCTHNNDNSWQSLCCHYTVS